MLGGSLGLPGRGRRGPGWLDGLRLHGCRRAATAQRPGKKTRVRGRVATSMLVALASLTATAGGITGSLATTGQWPGWWQPHRQWGWWAVHGRVWLRRGWRCGRPAGRPAPTGVPRRAAARLAAAACRSPARRAAVTLGGTPPRSWVGRGRPPSSSSTSPTRHPLRLLPAGRCRRPGRCRTCRPATPPAPAAEELPDTLARRRRVGIGGGGGRPTPRWWGRHPAGGRRVG